jgi:cytoskeleton protein RodZ
MPVQLQPIEELRRDGPISAIDPQTAGFFVPHRHVTRVATGSKPRIDSADDAIRLAELAEASEAAGPAEPAEPAEPAGLVASADPASRVSGVSLHAAEDAWIRVRERDSVIFEGILAAGQHFELPARVEAPFLKAGNAGGVFVFVDGVAYGPLGQRGQIARDISLLADDVRKSMPQAAPESLQSVLATVVHQRAEAPAVIPRP